MQVLFWRGGGGVSKVGLELTQLLLQLELGRRYFAALAFQLLLPPDHTERVGHKIVDRTRFSEIYLPVREHESLIGSG